MKFREGEALFISFVLTELCANSFGFMLVYI